MTAQNKLANLSLGPKNRQIDWSAFLYYGRRLADFFWKYFCARSRLDTSLSDEIMQLATCLFLSFFLSLSIDPSLDCQINF